MIDKRKNVCYVIWVNYWYEESDKIEIRKHKFISQHQFGSKRFNSFLEDYFESFFGFIGFLKDDLGSQSTISREIWNEVKYEVLQDITEKEKCY